MVSLAAIVLIQGALPISVLAFSDVKGTLEGNAISIDARAVDNRKVILESAMVKGWSGISRETVAFNSALSDQLAQSGLDVPGFLADATIAKRKPSSPPPSRGCSPLSDPTPPAACT